VTVRYPSLEDYFHTAAGEATYQLMLAIAATPPAELEDVEAEVAAWIADRLHQRK
jgi:hypothetical protein